MQSLEMFIGKNVKCIVPFSRGLAQAGSIPTTFYGVLRKVENDFCLFSDVKTDGGAFGSKIIDYSNNVVINKQYIIMIAEM